MQTTTQRGSVPFVGDGTSASFSVPIDPEMPDAVYQFFYSVQSQDFSIASIVAVKNTSRVLVRFLTAPPLGMNFTIDYMIVRDG